MKIYKRALLPIPASTTNGTEELVTGFDNPRTFTANHTLERRTPLSEKQSTAVRVVFGATQLDKKKASAGTVAVQMKISVCRHDEESAEWLPPPARRYTV
jgi:hypothetical protein